MDFLGINMQTCKHSWERYVIFPKCILSVFLIVVLVLSPIPVQAARTYSDPELARAVRLGFGTYRSDNSVVTYTQFYEYDG